MSCGHITNENTDAHRKSRKWNLLQVRIGSYVLCFDNKMMEKTSQWKRVTNETVSISNAIVFMLNWKLEKFNEWQPQSQISKGNSLFDTIVESKIQTIAAIDWVKWCVAAFPPFVLPEITHQIDAIVVSANQHHQRRRGRFENRPPQNDQTLLQTARHKRGRIFIYAAWYDESSIWSGQQYYLRSNFWVFSLLSLFALLSLLHRLIPDEDD